MKLVSDAPLQARVRARPWIAWTEIQRPAEGRHNRLPIEKDYCPLEFAHIGVGEAVRHGAKFKDYIPVSKGKYTIRNPESNQKRKPKRLSSIWESWTTKNSASDRTTLTLADGRLILHRFGKAKVVIEHNDSSIKTIVLPIQIFGYKYESLSACHLNSK